MKPLQFVTLFLTNMKKKMWSKNSATEALRSNRLTLEAQQKLVKESLTKAIEELHAGKSKHNACTLFKPLTTNA